jgi:hypothetical protein
MQRLERRDVKEPAATLMFRQCRNPRSFADRLPDPLCPVGHAVNVGSIALVGNTQKLVSVDCSRVPAC